MAGRTWATDGAKRVLSAILSGELELIRGLRQLIGYYGGLPDELVHSEAGLGLMGIASETEADSSPLGPSLLPGRAEAHARYVESVREVALEACVELRAMCERLEAE